MVAIVLRIPANVKGVGSGNCPHTTKYFTVLKGFLAGFLQQLLTVSPT